MCVVLYDSFPSRFSCGRFPCLPIKSFIFNIPFGLQSPLYKTKSVFLGLSFPPQIQTLLCLKSRKPCCDSFQLEIITSAFRKRKLYKQAASTDSTDTIDHCDPLDPRHGSLSFLIAVLRLLLFYHKLPFVVILNLYINTARILPELALGKARRLDHDSLKAFKILRRTGRSFNALSEDSAVTILNSFYVSLSESEY